VLTPTHRVMAPLTLWEVFAATTGPGGGTTVPVEREGEDVLFSRSGVAWFHPNEVAPPYPRFHSIPGTLIELVGAVIEPVGAGDHVTATGFALT